ncbi:MAG: flagellar assembly protein FliW, partial [candidate division Zixibacteria bacterium]|nr:flagellar assembly protein FliW [candidate division Zixibacteria bacterium]
SVAFIIVNPVFFCADYHIEVNPKEIEELDVADVKSVETYSIVSIPSDPKKMTINLQGPILINSKTKLAKQLILVNSKYKVKHQMIDVRTKTDKGIKQREMVGAV